MQRIMLKDNTLGGIFLSLLIFLGGGLFAAAEEPLTWEDCVQETSRQNPDLLAAQAVVRKARAAYLGSYSAFLPQVSANVGIDQGNSRKSGVSTSFDDNTIGLSADEPLFTGFKNTATVQQRHADLRTAQAQLAQARAQVGFDLKNAFAQLLYAEEQVKLAKSIADRRQQNLQLIELRYQAGREHQGSYLRIKAAAGQATFDVVQAERALRVAQQQLAQVLGRKGSAALEVAEMLVPAALPAQAPDVAALVALTPTHQQAQAQAESTQAGVTVARSEFFPTVSATGSLDREGSDWLPSTNRWLAGVVVSVPLFTGGRSFFDLQGAKAERDRTQAALTSADAQVRLNLEQNFAAFQDAVEQVGVQHEFLHAAEVRDEIARGQYAVGLLSFQDWDVIENDLIANQKTTLTTERDAIIAEATWERTLGRSSLP